MIKYCLFLFSLIIFLGGTNSIYAQLTDIPQQQLAVQLSATVQTSPPKINLHWKDIPWGPPVYTKIYRKAKNESSWGHFLDSIPYSAALTSYIDTNVAVDSAYEYRVTIGGGYTTCPLNTPNQTNSGGYIYAGIRAPAIHNRGTILLLVENTLSDSCSDEITTLMDDISGDGWQIIRHNFPKSTSDIAIKAVIINDYYTQQNVKAVLLLGHIAVPYSGDIKPDAHPEHEGAWPADVFYADMDGSWTDTSVNVVSGTYVANHNIPGDGKWDQSIIPSKLKLQVSRIDLSDMPAFPKSEISLMKNYLSKDHAYKLNKLNIRHRGVLNDALPANCGEGYSSNAYRNWAPLINKDSIIVAGYYYIVPFMAAQSYQWAYAAGGGSFTSCNQVGTTDSLVSKPNHTIFSMYFGSYFGDWNVQNNFLRAPLCQNPPTLTNCWVSRPNWFFHHMALGENIGFSSLLTQNNRKLSQDPFIDTTYSVFQNRSSLLVSVALMGDLTLRTDYIKPITNLSISSPKGHDALLSWSSSPEPNVLGYYVYRSDSKYGFYKRLNDSLQTTLSYYDSIPGKGLKFYMVRPAKLQLTPSGTYFNLGIGVRDSAYILSTVSLVDKNISASRLRVFPNPTSGKFTIKYSLEVQQNITIQVTGITGNTIFTESKKQFTGCYEKTIDLSGQAPGVYSISIISEKGIENRMIILY